jgi:integrase
VNPVAYQRTLADFDGFLFDEHLAEKKLCREQIGKWLGSLAHIKPSTKQGKLTHLRKFAGYLSSMGIPAALPELPRVKSDFTPYVFTSAEITQIFEIADDLCLTRSNSRISVELPMLLRILYGCGLRLGEAASLTWDDVNFDTGVLTIREAKNQKQRLVPMSEELTRILKLYKLSPCFDAKDHELIFKKENGEQRHKGAYWQVFNAILCELGIKNPQTTKAGRGPCIHSLRHSFAHQSLLKAASEGSEFLETVPFLSTYLGHSGLMETDKYLKARYELYEDAHATIADFTCDVFPEVEVGYGE